MSKRKRATPSKSSILDMKKTGEPTFIPSTAADCFLKGLHEEQSCDVTFLLGPSQEQVKAHRIFLMLRSEVFRANFSDRWETRDTIPIPQFDPNAFRSFLQFVYTDRVDLQNTDWMSVLKVTHYFLVKPLEDICVEIGLREACSDVSTVIEAFQTARTYDLKDLMDRLSEFMAKSFVAISKTEKFEDTIDDETLRHLLRLDYLRVNECDLFKIVLSVARARARAGGDGEDTEMSVATEMEKFLPLIRFPTMTSEEFKTVVDDSGLLSPGVALNLYRYFATSDVAKKREIASTLPYNAQGRCCTEFIKFYVTSSPSPKEDRRDISPDGLRLDGSVSFFVNSKQLPAIDVIKRMPSCGSNGFGITAVGVQCPALFLGTRECKDSLHCRIKIQQFDRFDWDRGPRLVITRFEMTCTVRPNEWTELLISPPLQFPLETDKGIRVTTRVAFGPSKATRTGERCTLVHYPPHVFEPTKANAEFCDRRVELADLSNWRGRTFSHDEWQLIRGIRIQAL